MAIHLHVKNDMLKETESTLHLMPCKIHADDPANVSVYFEPYIHKVDDEHYNSSFRGYPLQGKDVKVPTGYKGLTFYEYKKPETSNAERNLYCTGMFKKFTYWNYDKNPSKNDAFAAALDWIDIAEALHSM